MKDEELEPIEPALGSLFREERERGRAPLGSKDRVRERLSVSIGATGGGEPGSGGTGGATETPTGARPEALGGTAFSTSRLLPLIGAFLAGGVAGGLAVSTIASPRVVQVERVVEGSTVVSLPPIAIPSGSNAGIVPSEEPPKTLAAAPVSSGLGRDGALAREKAILDVARTALGRGDGAHALAAVNRHASEFPRGQMNEEREALLVQALTKLGRKEEALDRGARFRKVYPNSVLGPVVDTALESAQSNDFARASDASR